MNFNSNQKLDLKSWGIKNANSALKSLNAFLLN